MTYLLILLKSFASSSENIGIALDLCNVPIPTILLPVYVLVFCFAQEPEVVERDGIFSSFLLYVVVTVIKVENVELPFICFLYDFGVGLETFFFFLLKEVGVYNIIIAVSYTHLTLPTNREV